MGIPDSSLLDLIGKVRSWIYWENRNSNSVSCGFEMTDNNCTMCCHCKRNILNSCLKYHCQSCGRLQCGSCMQGFASFDEFVTSHFKETKEILFDIKSCKFCLEFGPHIQNARRCSGKVYPSESPRQSSEPPSPSFSGEKFDGHSPLVLTRSIDVSSSNHPSPVSVHHSPSRTDEYEGEDSTCHFFSAPSEYCCDTSGVDSDSISTRHEFYTCTSVGSSPSDSPSRIHITSNRARHYVQQDLGGSPMSQNDNSFDPEQAIL